MLLNMSERSTIQSTLLIGSGPVVDHAEGTECE